MRCVRQRAEIPSRLCHRYTVPLVDVRDAPHRAHRKLDVAYLEAIKGLLHIRLAGLRVEVPHQQEDPRDQEHQDGRQAGPEKQPGEDTETNVEHKVLQTDPARERTILQTSRRSQMARGKLPWGRVFPRQPKVRCDKVKDGQVRRDQGEVGDFGLSGSVEIAGLARQAVRMWERAALAETPREDTAAASASP